MLASKGDIVPRNTLVKSMGTIILILMRLQFLKKEICSGKNNLKILPDCFKFVTTEKYISSSTQKMACFCKIKS